MNKKPELIMLQGLPGSGKSAFAETLKQKGYIICSSDAIREELCGDVNCQDKNQEVFTVLHRRIKENLQNGRNVVYDACNISSKRRTAFLRELKHIECIKNIIVIATPYVQCLIQNDGRDREVPEHVIENMYKNWQFPYWFEGWDDIKIVMERTVNLTPEDAVSRLIGYDQKNHHHTLTLGEHLQAAWEFAVKRRFRSEVQTAAYLHDIGKPFTQGFVDSKGEPSEDAHYYQHHCVSAYDAMFYLTGEKFNPFRYMILVLITYHMMPYFWEKDEQHGEKTREKYRKLWGDDFYEALMQLHMADVHAH